MRPLLLLAALLASAPARVTHALHSRPVAHAGADSLMRRGISHALAITRAAHIADVRYELALDVTDPIAAVGHVTIRFRSMAPGDVILDFRGPSLSAMRVNGRAVREPEWNGAHVRIPASLVAMGTNTITADFRAAIAPAGASIIRFHDDTDGNDYLYTLLVPSDANALFPCFDQPDLKARTTLSLTVRPTWIAVGNGKVASIDSSGAASRTYRFAESDPLPTYLIAFAAGPWAHFTGGPRHTTLYVRASRAKEVEVDSLQDQVASSLTTLEQYFGIPYPFQKFDYLLAPAFPFGGMEHPGVTMFNEESFIYREPPTLTQRLGRRATIAHEVAHQWFGDLVTMRWFDDLWLKEGFATYMAAKVQDMEGLPNPWMTFYLRNKPLAYDVDQTAGTTPVWQALDNLDQAKSNYGPIVYNKAPGVLKQLEYLVGDSAFRSGVHDFLTSHAYANATWQDLLASVGKAAHRPLTQWGRDYILRAGMPVVEQELEVRDGRIAHLRLVQHPAQRSDKGGPWPMRVLVQVARGDSSRLIPVELTGTATDVRAAAGLGAPDFVFANAQDEGYALVLPDSSSARWLRTHIGEVKDPFLRAMLWGSLWDLVRDARLAPTDWMATALRELTREPDEQIASGIIGRIDRATTAYLSTAQRDSAQAQIAATLLHLASDSTRGYGLRKPALDAYIDLAQRPEELARLLEWLHGDLAAGMPLRQPTRWSIVTTLVARGARTSDSLLAAESQRDTTTGGKRRAFVAGAARPTATNKRAYFDRYFNDPSLNEDWVTASLRAFNDPDQAALTLPYLKPALDTLAWVQRNRRIFFLGSWLGGFVGGQRDAEALATVDRWLAAHPALPVDLRRKVLQVRDDLERTVAIRHRYAGEPTAASAGTR